MKRIIFIMAAAAIAAVSCTKEPVQEPDENGSVMMTFVATSQDTRTAIGDLEGGKRSISWVKGDEIRIFYNGKNTVAKSASDGFSTTFTAEVEPADAYYAVYPSSAVSSADAIVRDVAVTIPSVQDVSAGFAAAHYAAAVSDEENHFSFNNVCGWLKFTINNGSVRRIVVYGNNNEPITGKVTVSFDEDGKISDTEISDGAERLAIDIDAAGDYYVAVLPGTHLASGVNFDFYTAHDSGDGNAAGMSISTSNPLVVERSQIVNLGVLDDKMVSDWYIAPAAAGNGSGMSAANAAAGVEFLRAKLTEGVAAGDESKPIVIHAAAGEYDFCGEQIEVTWPDAGDYVKVLLDGTDGTVFTNTGESRFFNIGKNVNLTVKDIVFQGGNAGTGHGGAIYAEETAQEGNGSDVILELIGCTFNDNSADTGGALYIKGARSFTAVNTVFSGNAASTAAGAVAIAGSAREVIFEECGFNGNTAGRHGGALQNFGSGNTVISVKGGSFTGNRTTDAASGGGAAITFRGTDSRMTIDGCTISDNTAAFQGGAIRVNSANVLEITNSVISGNKAVTGGGLWINAGDAGLSGTRLTGNSATDKGGAIYVNGVSNVKLDGVAITENTAKTYSAGICIYAAADLFMNSCSVFDNTTTTTSTSTAWGPALFVNSVAEANVCINNSTFADQNVAVTSSDTNIDIQGGNLVFSNSTMIATSAAGLLRVHSSALSGTFINSIVINKGGKSINYNGPSGKLTSRYVISGTKQNSYNPTAEIDKAGVTFQDLGSPEFDRASGCYLWNGSLAGCPSAPDMSVAGTLINAANAEFYSWLESIGALDKDQLGNSRSLNRHGSYCGN